jgi:histidinol dehydrogenase
MKIHKYTDTDFKTVTDALVNRGDMDFQAQDSAVKEIIQSVKDEGDAAVLRLTNQFDRTKFKLDDLKVTEYEIEEAYKEVSNEELKAMQKASYNIRRFHERQVQETWQYEENGIVLGQMVTPLAAVGIYVPGGKASYPSSVLMNAVPARVAGVDKIIMCCPTPDGNTSPHVLVAADLVGVDAIYKIGGAQAVAAMALGTDSIPKVDKIVGPGNIYVALAKRIVFGLVDIDMIAGPSEILVIADDSAKPEFVAADLLSQAEHDEQAVPVLVTPSEDLAQKVRDEIDKQKMELKRNTIIEESLNSKCQLFVTQNLEDAIDLANRVAPEHLELSIDNPSLWVKKIRNAGAIFIGNYTPEAIGDYMAGPNHVLPTSGTARFSSPLGVYDFVKRTSLIEYSKDALSDAAETCATLAEMENLDAHANAVRIRISDSSGGPKAR